MTSPPGRITWGRQLRAVEAGGFVFTETRHAAGLVLPRHAHPHANFNLTVRGYCRETMRGGMTDCGPSSLVIKPPGEAHANRYGPAGARCLIVEVTPRRLAALDPGSRLFDPPTVVDRGPLVALAARMHAELAGGDLARDLVLEGLALEFLGLLARRRTREAGPAPPRWLRETRERLHDDGRGEPPGLSTLAGHAGVDPSHLARQFRRWYGCSVGEYVRRLRLERAARLLSGSTRPLAEVAAACGFCDQSHLSRAFRRHAGLTPAEYRRATRDDPARPTRPPRSKTPSRPGG